MIQFYQIIWLMNSLKIVIVEVPNISRKTESLCYLLLMLLLF